MIVVHNYLISFCLVVNMVMVSMKLASSLVKVAYIATSLNRDYVEDEK